jgi:LmbE family N-acetylglucosaminyl deacetylase
MNGTINDRVLIVAAHPDDEILGVGGTVAKYVDCGYDVFAVILGEGQASRYSGGEDGVPEMIDSLHDDAVAAAGIIGYKGIFFESLPDNRFDRLDLLDVVKKVETHIDTINPGIIFTHYGNDLNIDHRITHEAVITATRPLPGARAKKVLAFETLSSTEWKFDADHVFTPNVFVDISKYIEVKVKAMEKYKTELGECPHPRSKEGIVTASKRWGMVAGYEYAEAFQLIRALVD